MTATTRSLHLPAGSAATGPYALEVTPESAGWGYSSLRVLELAPGATHTLDTGEDEVLVVPLAGGCDVECEDATLTLSGRTGVFAGPTDFAYLPRGATAELRSAACRSGTARSPMCRSSCAGRAGAAGRSTTSPPRVCSRPTRSSPAR